MNLRILFVAVAIVGFDAEAQQFNGDNQWTAPYGVATLVGTVGEDYSAFVAVAALLPDWEFNLVATHFYDDPESDSGSYTSPSFYVKHRLSENEAQTAGYALMFGTGLTPEHLEQGEVSNAGESWWANGVATYNFNNDRVLLDILPGVVLNQNKGPSEDTAWGFTYTSRLAVYDVVPKSTIVAEVFGVTGEAYAPPSYRIGLRWEGKKLITALTFSDAFNGSGGAGLEFGFMYLTEPRLCWGGCRRNN